MRERIEPVIKRKTNKEERSRKEMWWKLGECGLDFGDFGPDLQECGWDLRECEGMLSSECGPIPREYRCSIT